jgi:multidrug transporter EmrE-like cation transporter
MLTAEEKQMNSTTRSWHGLDVGKFGILAGVIVFGTSGDTFLARGMQGAQVSIHHLPSLILMLWNPWVILGIVLLIGFFATWTWALSFTDLSFLLPATSGIGFVLLTLVAKLFLHENISAWRWAGIALIAMGVGFVTSGPSRTATARGVQSHPPPPVGSA